VIVSPVHSQDIKGHTILVGELANIELHTDLAALNPKCRNYKYTPVNDHPDRILQLFTEHKRYRLVIGAGEFRDDPDFNRQFVAPTAELIDRELADLGYLPLPNLREPLLVGKNATKQAIKAALEQMRNITKAGDLGLIYYVGHGTITPSHEDLSLAVYDRPVVADEGLRVSDLLGILELGEWREDVTEIPHLLLVLETCYSGVVARQSNAAVISVDGLQRIAKIQSRVVPPQVTIISATADGDASEAYPLAGTGVSAFGYFFARALKEDWACADVNSPDGILTVSELKNYIEDRLALAYKLSAISSPMLPAILNRDENSFIAYRPAYHYIDGARERIVRLSLSGSPNHIMKIKLPNGNQYQCSDREECSLNVSSAARGEIEIVTQDSGAQSRDKPLKVGHTDFSALLKAKHAMVAGVTIRVQ
jgi:hypothetical protein